MGDLDREAATIKMQSLQRVRMAKKERQVEGGREGERKGERVKYWKFGCYFWLR
jgi:hypothetical protein